MSLGGVFLKFAWFARTKDRVILVSILISILLILFLYVFLSITFSRLPSQIPLFYSNPWGANQLASTAQIFILPSLAFLCLLINLMAGWYLHESQKALKRILSITSLTISLLVFIAGVRIVTIFN